MWILEFTNYKAFLRALIKTFPGHGRGQAARLAEHLGVTPMVISHILTGERHFTQEQALMTAKFFGLDSRATDYFLVMIHFARAESADLKAFYQQKLDAIRRDAENIKNLVASREELSENDKGIYYANWYYSGVWLITFVKGYQTVDSIAEYFGLSRSRVGEIVAFLVNTGLCVEQEGFIVPGKTALHVNKDSEFVNSHRRNWREKAREKFTEPDEADIFYSSPVSISKKDAEEFRKQLLALIKDFSKRVEASPAQTLMCFNVDWFKF